MSFSDLKGGQVACAKTFDRSIAVIAGAGSGKTFTLRERVAKAFDVHQEDGQEGPIVESIEQVMAITFTEKAAAELRSRIKAALREIGRPDQAVLVDDAWIGTIHGTCSRILRENAFDLGLDPNFRLVPDDEWDEMRTRAIDAALSGASVSYEAAQALFVEYAPQAVKESIAALMDLAAGSAGGFSDIVAPPAPELRSLQQSIEDELGIRSRVALPPLPNVGAGAFSEIVAWREAVRELIEEALFGGVPADGEEGGGSRGGSGAKKKGKGCPISPKLFLDLELALAWPFQDVLFSIAADAVRIFDGMKLAHGMLDQDDLLLKTAAALERPEIARRYENRFGLVMVDEFQDTDPVQLAIIGHLTGPDDCRLCVVGDPQQSIYRFRGADVSTYSRHVDALPARSKIALDDNYRSHADILAFTDLVFTDDTGAAIGAYQPLNARRDESKFSYDEDVEGPRVSVVDVRYPRGSVTDARRCQAEAVARRFEQIHEASGRSYGDMAILLGAMTGVADFTAALQRHNIPYVVAKGSVLSSMPEAKGVVALARAIASREDSEALFNVEESAFFGLTPADFTNMKMGAGNVDGGDNKLSKRVEAARHVLARARRRIGQVPLSQLLADILHESGWVARLEDEVRRDAGCRAANHAKLANALKVVRMAEDIEGERCCDAAFVASTLAARMENLSEPPGALSAKDSNFVRIMTIHASKGLQFPIVAVSGFDGKGGQDGSSRIVSERMADDGGRVWQCALLDPGISAGEYEKSSGKCRAQEAMLKLVASEKEAISDERARRYIWPGEDAVPDAAQFRAALVAHARAAEDAELERKLYVAFTRAQEALIVCMKAQVTKKGVSVPKGVQERIVAAHEQIAARWEYRFEDAEPEEDGDLPSADAATGAGAPDGADVCGAAGEGDAGAGDEAAEDEAARFLLPDGFARRPRGDWPYVFSPDADVFSASSLAALEEAEGQVRGIFSAPADDGEDRRADADDDVANLRTRLAAPPADGDPVDGDPAGDAPAECELARAAANVRGEALHACAQFAALHTTPESPICALSPERLCAIAHAHGLFAQADIDELDTRMRVWTGSAAAQKMASFAHLCCEEPFFICLDEKAGDDAASYLRGFIDLLAYDEPGRGAVQVVDYKTGYLDMTPAERGEHFTLQAECYAFALLAQGFTRVELSFLFLDDVDGTGEPQTVAFGPFTADVEDDTARDADGTPCTRTWLLSDLRERVAHAAS